MNSCQDYRKPGSQSKQWFLGMESVFGGSGNPAYPGGQFFNLFNLGSKPEELKSLKSKELEHGRLAMLAFLGFLVQAGVTGQGPYENLLSHIDLLGRGHQLRQQPLQHRGRPLDIVTPFKLTRVES